MKLLIIALCIILIMAGCTKVQGDKLNIPKEENKGVAPVAPPKENHTQDVPAKPVEGNETPPKPVEEKPVLKGCVDTDTDDITIQGTVTSEGKTYADTCSNIQTVKEYYCDGKIVKSLLKTCKGGTTCQKGACKEPLTYCKDTDNGLNLTVYGEVSISRGTGIGDIYKDQCWNTTYISEYYCNNNTAAVEIVACKDGASCRTSACGQILYCTDSDNGINSVIKGVLTVVERRSSSDESYTSSVIDECLDSETLNEYYCNGNAISTKVIACKGGCDIGRCFGE